MGAQLWHHLAPWRLDPADALFELQVRFVNETYDLPALLQQHLESARESVRLCTDAGDPYELLDLYRAKLDLVDHVLSRPLPTLPRAQIELVRQLCADSGEGVGNVLDVTGVSDRGELECRKLAPEDVRRYCGTEQPTRRQAEEAVGKINEELRRGESVCFPVFDDDAAAAAIGWYFVGNTID